MIPKGREKLLRRAGVCVEEERTPWSEDCVTNLMGKSMRIVRRNGTRVTLQPGETVTVDNPEEQRA